ncbi:MAG: hypothetical protein H7293_03185, partial [Candidatus Saccharibacteria bacterium]|nr:hypothetical protein [Rhodoferax sp.]
PAMQGYKVDNKPRRYKVHEDLPKRVSLRVAGDIDMRYKLGRLIADEGGDYWNLRPEKIVVIDTFTGEIRSSPYSGSIQCFEGGNLALYIDPGREGTKSFQYGKFGEALQVWEDTLRLPIDKHLNQASCTIETAPKRQLKDGTKVPGLHDLLPEHGKIAVVESAPRPGNTADLSADAKALMQQPFMQTMGVSAPTEYWVLIKPNGNEIPIPNNPGESLASRLPGLDYLPYLSAYFTPAAIRLMLPETALARPVFGRLIYPDGRVELLGIPDIIQTPRSNRYLHSRSVIYTKVGVIWRIEFVRYGANRTDYSGDLEEGYYLQQSATKTLLKLPELREEKSPKDGCTLQLKDEIVQRRPFLVNTSHINICTGE